MSRFGQRTRPSSRISTWLPQGGFNPSSLNPDLWLDASVSSSITASGNAVSQWNDLSGNARHVTQATAANQPSTNSRTQNGLNVIDFDGGDFLSGGDILDLGSNGLTAIGVAKFDTTGNGTLWGKSRANNLNGRWSVVRDGGTLTWLLEGSGSNVTKSDTSTSCRTVGWTMTRNTTNGSVGYLNGANQGAANTTGTTSYDTSDLFFIGAYQSSTGGTPPLSGVYLDGFIAELLIWLRPLSADDLSAVEGYLNSKWAVY